MNILAFEILGTEIPLGIIFLLGILAVFIIWKLIKFAVKILIVVVIFFLILFGLDILGVFGQIQNLLSSVI